MEINVRSLAYAQEQAHLLATPFGHSNVLVVIPYDLSDSADVWNIDFTVSDLATAIRSTEDTSPGEDRKPA